MNWGEFFYMGGYWPYVWASYGAALLVLAWNVIAPWRRAKTVHRRLHEFLHRHRGSSE